MVSTSEPSFLGVLRYLNIRKVIFCHFICWKMRFLLTNWSEPKLPFSIHFVTRAHCLSWVTSWGSPVTPENAVFRKKSNKLWMNDVFIVYKLHFLRVVGNFIDRVSQRNRFLIIIIIFLPWTFFDWVSRNTVFLGYLWLRPRITTASTLHVIQYLVITVSLEE